MKVKFISKDTKLADNTQEKIIAKIELRLGKYFKDDDAEITVKASKGKNNSAKVELSLNYYGYKLRSEAGSADGVFAAFDKSLDTIERQMEKCKTRATRGRYDSSFKTMEVDSGVEVPTQDEFTYNVVRTKAYDMKPMDVQEAILQMEFLGHSFFMFCRTDGKICTVYRRDDGDYGMIEQA
ncbi:MAG: ribosome-associated translation inhibitor RaiA [Clostridia bacterium]|nr:ribosome-associated translation inhibitor RaiA [Clostridia bacterium]